MLEIGQERRRGAERAFLYGFDYKDAVDDEQYKSIILIVGRKTHHDQILIA